MLFKNSEDDESYKTKSIEDFSCLGEEILKIAGNKGAQDFRSQYKSENRQNKKKVVNSQSFRAYPQHQKGKPPLKTGDNTDQELTTALQRHGDKRPIYKQKIEQKTNKLLNKNVSQKSSRVNSIDGESQQNTAAQKKTSKIESKEDTNQIVSNFEDLIQRKKEALGIKPLNSTLNNYKVVYNENEKLQKIIEEQKRTIKLMRQEKVEQLKELTKHIENEKKLEVMVKQETPSRSRQNKSEYRNKSRESSNVSNHKAAATKSPAWRTEAEQAKSNIDKEIAVEYSLKKSDTIKKLNPSATEIIVQPKIRGKDHNEVITTELLKKSSLEMKKQSFSSLKELERLAKINRHNLNTTNSEIDKSTSRIIESGDHSILSMTFTNDEEILQYSSRQNERLELSPIKESKIPSIKASPVKLKYSQKRK